MPITKKRIKVKYSNDINKYFRMEDDIDLTFFIEQYDKNEIISETQIDNSEIYIKSLDDDFISVVYDETTNTHSLQFKKEGSAVLLIIYQDLHIREEIITYQPHIKNIYKQNLLTEQDRIKLEENDGLELLFDTIMEMFDIYYAYNNDIKTLRSPRAVKSKMVDTLGTSLGFPKIDYTKENTSLEYLAEKLYKELLHNYRELIEIRGTALPYELFFGALGFEVTIDEFWFDEDGNLIEIDPHDDNKSTFFRYDTEGRQIDFPPVPKPDPRKNNSPDKKYFINQKSNYLRVNISKKPGIYPDSYSSFSESQRKIIRKYLAILKPSNMQYLNEVFNIQVPQEIIDLNTEESFSNIQIKSLIITDPETDVGYYTMYGSYGLDKQRVYVNKNEYKHFLKIEKFDYDMYKNTTDSILLPFANNGYNISGVEDNKTILTFFDENEDELGSIDFDLKTDDDSIEIVGESSHTELQQNFEFIFKNTDNWLWVNNNYIPTDQERKITIDNNWPETLNGQTIKTIRFFYRFTYPFIDGEFNDDIGLINNRNVVIKTGGNKAYTIVENQFVGNGIVERLGHKIGNTYISLLNDQKYSITVPKKYQDELGVSIKLNSGLRLNNNLKLNKDITFTENFNAIIQ